MAVFGAYKNNYTYYGTSAERSATVPPATMGGSIFFSESDTGARYIWDGSTWTLDKDLSYNKVWDAVALAWVAETQSLVSTDTLNVDADITDDATRVLGQVSGVPEAIVTYQSGTDLYLCTAAPGSAVASAVWRVMKLDSSSGSVIKWADGNANYDNLASDLATVAGLSYS